MLTCNSKANYCRQPIKSNRIARAALFAAFVTAATASFGQYNVTVLNHGAADVHGVAYGATTSNIYGYAGNHASTWDLNTGAHTDQNPTDYNNSIMVTSTGSLIGGWVGDTTANRNLSDAYIWNSASGTGQDVAPDGPGVLASAISGMGGHLATGYLYDSSSASYSAEVWDLSNNYQASTLSATNFTSSSGKATDGTRIVGLSGSGPLGSALYWSNVSSDAVNISPGGSSGSVANSISGNIIAGIALDSSNNQAAYAWNATTLTGQFLSGGSFASSAAYGTNGTLIVGIGHTSGRGFHAVVWNPGANTYLDLNGSFDSSVAESINAQGDVFGYEISGGSQYAVEWTPQAAPEPSGLLILGGLATLGVVFIRRK